LASALLSFEADPTTWISDLENASLLFFPLNAIPGSLSSQAGQHSCLPEPYQSIEEVITILLSVRLGFMEGCFSRTGASQDILCIGRPAHFKVMTSTVRSALLDLHDDHAAQGQILDKCGGSRRFINGSSLNERRQLHGAFEQIGHLSHPSQAGFFSYCRVAPSKCPSAGCSFRLTFQ